MESIVFSHANSFGAGTYQVLFDALRQRGFSVHAPEQFGHHPNYPVTEGWPYLVSELHDFTAPLVERLTHPVWLVGHSLGGFVSLLTACRYPHLCKGVILLDSPLVAGWRSGFLKFIKRTGLIDKFPPVHTAKVRRTTWPSLEAAMKHFASKPVFAKWEKCTLEHYVKQGTQLASNGQRELTFSREVEAAIYRTIPDNWPSFLKEYPVSFPVVFVGGTQSKELRQAGISLIRKVTRNRIMLVNGSHLFPMETPIPCASYIESCILEMMTMTPTTS